MSEFSSSTKAKTIWLAAMVFSLTITLSAQTPAKPLINRAAPPDLNSILQSMETVEQRNPAHSHSFEVTRNYQVFRADDKQPTSEITAEISFIPPNVEKCKITQASGNPRGVKIVDAILDREMKSAADGAHASISRMNYDFTFLRQENFGLVPEYVLLLVPKRKQKDLLRGQIWVDAKTFHIRRMEGVPAKNPSWWIKDVHITLQFAAVNEMWIPVSFDAIANLRLLGQFTLAGITVAPQTPVSLAKAN